MVIESKNSWIYAWVVDIHEYLFNFYTREKALCSEIS